jgi:SAM-dependent methyltransferase
MMLKAVAHAIMSHPRLYQIVQVLLGQRRSMRQLRNVLDGLPSGRTLDIGSSAGALGRRLVDDAVGLDIDVLPLLEMKRAMRAARAAGGDAAALPFANGAFDLSLCIAVSHHLDDRSFDQALSEIGRVTRGRFVFLDALRTSRLIGRILWRYDRGSHPRSRAELLSALEKWFTIERTIDYGYLHDYVICVARPRATPGRT